MHPEILSWCEAIKQLHPEHFKNKRVLEIGSYTVNGSVRELFHDCDYIGIDVATGPGVDLVCIAHDLHEPDASFDVVVSTQALEHDMYHHLTLINAVQLLKPKGLMLLTCATGTTWMHGVQGHGAEDSLTTQMSGQWSSYYQNISPDELQKSLQDPDEVFEEWNMKVQTNSAGGQDLLFYGIKRE